jgi:hypothetical protein
MSLGQQFQHRLERTARHQGELATLFLKAWNELMGIIAAKNLVQVR